MQSLTLTQACDTLFLCSANSSSHLNRISLYRLRPTSQVVLHPRQVLYSLHPLHNTGVVLEHCWFCYASKVKEDINIKVTIGHSGSTEEQVCPKQFCKVIQFWGQSVLEEVFFLQL